MVFWILVSGSVVVLPVTALLALRWAIRQGEFDDLQKTALSIFDDEEPLGQITDHFPVRADPGPNQRSLKLRPAQLRARLPVCCIAGFQPAAFGKS